MAKYQLSKEDIKQLQRLIGTKEDGLWGPKSKAALNEFTLSQFEPMTEPSTAEYNPLFATDRLPVKVDKPEPLADYREVKQDKEPINYMDALLALKNLESNRPMPRVPSSWVGWASYINSGDRGLLSEFAEADKAWNMKKLEEEEKARQLIYNIREKELDRKNAKEIALMNRNASEDKSDEYMKQFQLAENDLEFAKQMLDVSNPESIARFEKALTLRNHYAAKLKDIDLESKPEKYEDSYSVKINKAIAKIKALGRQKKWNDEERDEYDRLMEIVPITDERRAELESIRKDKPATPEDKNRGLAAANAEFKRTGKNPDPKKYNVKWFKGKPDHLVPIKAGK